MVRDVALELQRAQMELRHWQEYKLLYKSCSEHLTLYWQQCETFWSLLKKQECDIKLLNSRINNIKVSDFEASPPQSQQEGITCWEKKHPEKNI